MLLIFMLFMLPMLFILWLVDTVSFLLSGCNSPIEDNTYLLLFLRLYFSNLSLPLPLNCILMIEVDWLLGLGVASSTNSGYSGSTT